MNYAVVDLESLNLKKELLYGYSKTQVEKIFEKIKDDYDEFAKEISKLHDEVAVMKTTVQHYKSIEESLQHTLILAHSTGESIKLNATDRATNIIQEAEIKAKKMISDADLQVERIKSEYEEIKSNLSCYKMKTQSLLNSIQELLKVPIEDVAE